MAPAAPRASLSAITMGAADMTGMVVPSSVSTSEIFAQITSQAATAAEASAVMAPHLNEMVMSHSTLPDAIAAVISSRISSGSALPRDILATELSQLLGEPTNAAAAASDLLAVVESDPAAPDLLTVMLHFKGFLALQCHRAAHSLWTRRDGDAGATQLALMLQGRASELFGVDIHPGAQIGAGVFIDHATGLVVGEQASVGSGCYILHGVTLGATGKRDKATGRRHPCVGSGVTIGSGASLLGPITVGDGATIGTQAVVTKSVEAGATVIDTGYLGNKVLAPRKKKAAP